MPSAVEARRSAAAAHVQVALNRRHSFSRQHVGAQQVEFSPNLPRQIGQVDARLLGEAERQVLHGADGLQRVAACPGLFREACDRRFADECDVTERMVGEPRIYNSVLELGPCLRRHSDRTADLPQLVDESTRDLDGFRLECAEGACARAFAKELIHLACEDPRVDEGTHRLQPKARLSHLGYCADPPEQGVAPDYRIGSPSLDRRGSKVDFRGERDRVLVHARPQCLHPDVGPDFRPGLQIGLRRFLTQAGACHEAGQGEACGRAHERHTTARLTTGVEDGMRSLSSRPTSICANRICPYCCWHRARPSDPRSIVGPRDVTQIAQCVELPTSWSDAQFSFHYARSEARNGRSPRVRRRTPVNIGRSGMAGSAIRGSWGSRQLQPAPTDATQLRPA
jgi:hypothetical protein